MSTSTQVGPTKYSRNTRSPSPLTPPSFASALTSTYDTLVQDNPPDDSLGFRANTNPQSETSHRIRKHVNNHTATPVNTAAHSGYTTCTTTSSPISSSSSSNSSVSPASSSASRLSCPRDESSTAPPAASTTTQTASTSELQHPSDPTTTFAPVASVSTSTSTSLSSHTPAHSFGASSSTPPAFPDMTAVSNPLSTFDSSPLKQQSSSHQNKTNYIATKRLQLVQSTPALGNTPFEDTEDAYASSLSFYPFLSISHSLTASQTHIHKETYEQDNLFTIPFPPLFVTL